MLNLFAFQMIKFRKIGHILYHFSFYYAVHVGSKVANGAIVLKAPSISSVAIRVYKYTGIPH